jgi:hypothetical protein
MVETKSKFCKNCGREVALDGEFCPQCGLSLSEQEIIVGYSTNVYVGGTLGSPNGMLLFTTDRVVVTKGTTGYVLIPGFNPREEGLLFSVGFKMGTALAGKDKAQAASKISEARDKRPYIDALIKQDKKNFAVLYPEIEQIRVKLPGRLTKGNVTLKTTTGERMIHIGTQGVTGGMKADWGFLTNPPSKLADKLIVK